MSLINWYTQTALHQWWVNNVWKPSWTRFTTAIYGIPALAVTAAQEVSKFANDNTISSYLATMNVPNWVPMGMAGIAMITYIAHGRE